MIGEVLSSVEAAHVAKVDALRSKIADADAEKINREAIAEAAVATTKEKLAEVTIAGKALEEAEVATNAAMEAQKVAISEQKAGDADLLAAGAKKAMAEKVVREDLCPLLGGTSADISKSVNSVAKIGKELDLEAQLIQSAELAMRTVPAERGSFDNMVAQQVKEQFGKAIAMLADQFANGEVGKAERAGKVEACNQRVAAAVAHSESCQAQLEAAKAALEEAEAARAAAEKSVEDLGPEMEKAVASAEAADALLVACKADVATFAGLVEGPAVALGTAPVEEAIGEAVQVAGPDAVQAVTPDATAA